MNDLIETNQWNRFESCTNKAMSLGFESQIQIHYKTLDSNPLWFKSHSDLSFFPQKILIISTTELMWSIFFKFLNWFWYIQIDLKKIKLDQILVLKNRWLRNRFCPNSSIFDRFWSIIQHFSHFQTHLRYSSAAFLPNSDDKFFFQFFNSSKGHLKYRLNRSWN